MQNSLL